MYGLESIMSTLALHSISARRLTAGLGALVDRCRRGAPALSARSRAGGAARAGRESERPAGRPGEAEHLSAGGAGANIIAVGRQGWRADGRLRLARRTPTGCSPRSGSSSARSTCASRLERPRIIGRGDAVDRRRRARSRRRRPSRSATSSTRTAHPDHVGGNEKLRLAGRTFTGGNVAGQHRATPAKAPPSSRTRTCCVRMTTPGAGEPARRPDAHADRHLLHATR